MLYWDPLEWLNDQKAVTSKKAEATKSLEWREKPECPDRMLLTEPVQNLYILCDNGQGGYRTN